MCIARISFLESVVSMGLAVCQVRITCRRPRSPPSRGVGPPRGRRAVIQIMSAPALDTAGCRAINYVVHLCYNANPLVPSLSMSYIYPCCCSTDSPMTILYLRCEATTTFRSRLVSKQVAGRRTRSRAAPTPACTSTRPTRSGTRWPVLLPRACTSRESTRTTTAGSRAWTGRTTPGPARPGGSRRGR